MTENIGAKEIAGASHERLERLATVLGFHTDDCLHLYEDVRRGRLSPAQAEAVLYARFSRSITALLACVHPQGPP